MSLKRTSMKINLINPNTNASMTQQIANSAQAVVSVGTTIRAVSPDGGAASIECHRDEAVAALGVVEEVVRGEADGCAAHIIACFGDPGLDAAREVASGPVIGIAEAAMQAASLVATGFSIVTTLERTVIIAEHLVVRYGMQQRCRRVRAVDIAVLDLEDPAACAYERILAESQAALAQDRCDAIVLGCAGMSELARRLGTELGVPVIDGVTIAVGFAEALVRSGIGTSKRGDYAAPPFKTYAGWSERFSR